HRPSNIYFIGQVIYTSSANGYILRWPSKYFAFFNQIAEEPLKSGKDKVKCPAQNEHMFMVT
ncbi:MAG: hypothetical protein IJ511_05255, partial [Bacteroides sp.]|nr:hypothetical protein [Bacteroides sp.]